MARARRSLSPNASSLLTGKHKTTSKLFGDKTERDSTFDLEEGEITEEEAKSEESRDTVTIGTETSMPTPSAEMVPETLPQIMVTEPEAAHPLSATAIENAEPPAARTPLEAEQVNPDIGLSCAAATAEPDSRTPRTLSPEELELAKNIVLDLLGWGVQPEYLVECGVSSHAIYRIFTDLHLRLPSNLSYLG
ncbi:hypothetical protein D9615_003445 [Tricholomella constricta]|uniref:Uncharacterized protein n=1 Tax=Tricholomella constricta TaxID=117010 RepID=A0A8H5HJN5_9AGAR|nr:hypothetical protein D9615_003445 [Tricholomella constricta]